jgi:histidine ammonia-lyase
MDEVVFDTGTNELSIWARFYSTRVTPRLSDRAIEAIKISRNAVETILASGKAVYGINTGFGKLADQLVPPADLDRLQENLVLAHSIGAGEPLPTKVVRLAIALKIGSFAKGYSGVRLELVERLSLFLDHEIYPIIPEKGSVGASGDLVPLAHVSAALIGMGDVDYKGRAVSSQDVHSELGWTPLRLAAKEGLAMLNGTQISTALALAALFEVQRAFATAVIVGSLTTQAFLGLDEAFDGRIHALRRHKGQIEVADTIKRLISNSECRSLSLTTGRRQDPYCIRCQPQILGPCRDTISHAARILTDEADAVTDNPLVFADRLEILSGGNFHAEPVAFVADSLAIAICEIGSLSERRLALITDPTMSGLPAFLTSDPGLSSGFMSAQIAAAAMVAENRQKAHPATVDNVPTVANQEDIVSMATHGARRLLEMVNTLDYILASELLAATEASDHRGLALGSALDAVHDIVREVIPRMNVDRFFAPAHKEARRLVKDTLVLQAVGWKDFYIGHPLFVGL